MTIKELKTMLELLPERRDNEEIKGYNWATGNTFDIDKQSQYKMEESIEEFGWLFLDMRPTK